MMIYTFVTSNRYYQQNQPGIILNMKNKQPNIRDVARKAGVSAMAVSRILNQKSGVSEEMRKKVHEACSELGYQLNPSIQDMVRKGLNGHTRNLAFVIASRDLFSHPVYAAAVEGVVQGSFESSYNLSFSHISGSEKNIYDLPPLLRDKRIDGLLITGNLDEKIISLIKKLRLPYIILGVYDWKTSGSSTRIQLDIDSTALRLVAEMKKSGKRRIAYAFSNPDNFYSSEFHEAYKRALKEFSLKFDEKNVYRIQQCSLAALDVFKDVLMKKSLPFDSIICEDFRHAQEISYLLGVRSGVFGKNDIMLATSRTSEFQRLPVPAVYFDSSAFQEAFNGIRLLIDMISGKRIEENAKIELSTKVYTL